MFEILKLDEDMVREALENDRDNDRDWQLGTLQVAVFVAAGGGFLGQFLAEQPADAYIDTRAGKLPYSRRALMNMVKVLRIMAEVNGYDPHHLPPVPSCHNCGVF